jgi:two-component system nitrogen regulation sensor histidine kinase NtrY
MALAAGAVAGPSGTPDRLLMSVTVRPARPPSAAPPSPRGDGGVPLRAERRPFRDNPRLILLGIFILLVALVAMVTLADRSAELNPNFLTEVVLYALSVADLTMLVALGFVLARNIIKLVVERRRGLPFSRFRAKLVGALLGLTIIPALLVLLVGGELIRSSTEKWVSQPVDDVLSAAKQIAGEYYREREEIVARGAASVARTVPAGAIRSGDAATIRRLIEAEVTGGRVRGIDVYALAPGEDPVPIVAARSPMLPRADVRALTDALASRVARGGAAVAHESVEGGGKLLQAGALLTDPATRQPVGVVIATDHLTEELAAESDRIISAYENYSRLRWLSRPLQGIYLSLFVMMTLMILVSATWMGLYLAKRITRPTYCACNLARK